MCQEIAGLEEHGWDAKAFEGGKACAISAFLRQLHYARPTFFRFEYQSGPKTARIFARAMLKPTTILVLGEATVSDTYRGCESDLVGMASIVILGIFNAEVIKQAHLRAAVGRGCGNRYTPPGDTP